MIFIGGISNGVKQLFYGRKMFCRYCGELSQISLVMTYTYFSFFFIPIFKWNKKFYLEFKCCRRQYEVPYETGMRILRGEDIEIDPSELRLVGRGNYEEPVREESVIREPVYQNAASGSIADAENSSSKAVTSNTPPKAQEEEDIRYCPSCGGKIDISFKYCPHCGNKL